MGAVIASYLEDRDMRPTKRVRVYFRAALWNMVTNNFIEKSEFIALVDTRFRYGQNILKTAADGREGGQTAPLRASRRELPADVRLPVTASSAVGMVGMASTVRKRERGPGSAMAGSPAAALPVSPAAAHPASPPPLSPAH
jgi:hypothetical protein